MKIEEETCQNDENEPSFFVAPKPNMRWAQQQHEIIIVFSMTFRRFSGIATAYTRYLYYDGNHAMSWRWWWWWWVCDAVVLFLLWLNTWNIHPLFCLFHQLIACFELKTTQLSALLLFPYSLTKLNRHKKSTERQKCITLVYGIMCPWPGPDVADDDYDKAQIVRWKAISTAEQSLFCRVSKQGKEHTLRMTLSTCKPAG